MEIMLLDTLLSLFSNAFFSLPVLILLILDVVALRTIWKSETRSEGSKILWTILVFFFPLGGLILWWIFG